MTEEQHEREFAHLTQKISRERGFGCASYKDKCLRRRIAVRMRARGVHSYGDYARLLDADLREYDLLLDALTINVTKLFRNWSTFAAIAEHVVPALLALESPVIRIWSAGCASGEEAYSLAILLHRAAGDAGRLSRLAGVQVLGTDIDRASLDRAERGEYAEAAFADTPPEIRRDYFSPDAPHIVAPEIRSMVRFARHDLLRDPPPSLKLHLITCRNVVIYFDRASQEALFQRFGEALAPAAFLVLGKVETLLGPARGQFAAVEPRERIFRRL